MSKDLRIANVYLMPLCGENKNKIIEEINSQRFIFQKLEILLDVWLRMGWFLEIQKLDC